MNSIGEVIQSVRRNDCVEKSERAQTIKEIFAIYTSQQERTIRKVENWKRYCSWCRVKGESDNQVSRKLFRQSSNFLKEMNIRQFCFLTSHIPTKDLYYVKSVCSDKSNRGESVGAFILGSRKLKHEQD